MAILSAQNVEEYRAKYADALKAYEEEKSPSKKLSIKKQWNQWYDALDEDIKKHKHDRFRDASSVFITDINKIQ